MQQLTPAAEQLVFNLADRYRVSTDAVKALLMAVINGGGTMAQFYHPELGGNGQWMRGGMTMVGDMFNYGLQGTVSGICSELSNFTANNQAYVPLPPAAQGQGQFQGSGFGSFGGFGNWWPGDLGSPSSSGGQNDSRYAYFPQARRLAVQHNGQVTVYDTLDHQIGGVQQQQGGAYGSQSFTSQFGTFTVDSLPVVSGGSQNANAPAPPQAPAPMPEQAPYNQSFSGPSSGNEPGGDLIALLERLGSLRDKGILSDQEFQSKKAELLARL